MAKEKKTKQELRDMVAKRVNVGGVQIIINPTPPQGWSATIVTAPQQTSKYQAYVDNVVLEMNSKYDLAD